MSQMVKNLPAVWETSLFPELGIFPGEGNGYLFQYSCLENRMEREAWRIAWREEPGGPQSMESQGVGHDCKVVFSLGSEKLSDPR